MSSNSSRTYSAPALAKGLEILELLAESPDALSQAEIARRLDRSVSEQFRMLSALQDLGYVHRDELGAYSLTLKLYSLAARSRAHDPLVRLSRGPMREYALASGQECHLCVLEGGQVIVLANENAAMPVSVTVRAGSVHHPLRTASGRLLLAALTDEDQRWQLARAKEKFPEVKFRLADELKKLAALRGQLEGHARDESVSGLADFVILLASDVCVSATLASSWFYSATDAAEEKRLATELRRAAATIREMMG